MTNMSQFCTKVGVVVLYPLRRAVPLSLGSVLGVLDMVTRVYMVCMFEWEFFYEALTATL